MYAEHWAHLFKKRERFVDVASFLVEGGRPAGRGPGCALLASRQVHQVKLRCRYTFPPSQSFSSFSSSSSFSFSFDLCCSQLPTRLLVHSNMYC